MNAIPIKLYDLSISLSLLNIMTSSYSSQSLKFSSKSCNCEPPSIHFASEGLTFCKEHQLLNEVHGYKAAAVQYHLADQNFSITDAPSVALAMMCLFIDKVKSDCLFSTKPTIFPQEVIQLLESSQGSKI